MSLELVDLMRLNIAYKAVADACEKKFKDEARAEFARGIPVTWKPPNVGNLVTQLTQDAVTVTDQEKLLDYLQARYPEAVVVKTEMVTTRTVSPAWQASVLAGLEPMDPQLLKAGEATGLMDREGTIVSGAMFRKGGSLHSVGWTPNAGLRKEYEAAALAYLESGVPLPVAPPAAAIEAAPDAA